MPGKVNPVMCEMLMQVAAQVIGNDSAITVAGTHGNFELNVMMPVIAHNLLQSISLLASGSRIFARRCVSGLEAKAEHCAAEIERSLAMCTVSRSADRLRSGRRNRQGSPRERAQCA